MSVLGRIFSRWSDDRRGNVAIIMALCSGVLIHMMPAPKAQKEREVKPGGGLMDFVRLPVLQVSLFLQPVPVGPLQLVEVSLLLPVHPRWEGQSHVVHRDHVAAWRC